MNAFIDFVHPTYQKLILYISYKAGIFDAI